MKAKLDCRCFDRSVELKLFLMFCTDCSRWLDRELQVRQGHLSPRPYTVLHTVLWLQGKDNSLYVLKYGTRRNHQENDRGIWWGKWARSYQHVIYFAVTLGPTKKGNIKWLSCFLPIL